MTYPSTPFFKAIGRRRRPSSCSSQQNLNDGRKEKLQRTLLLPVHHASHTSSIEVILADFLMGYRGWQKVSHGEQITFAHKKISTATTLIITTTMWIKWSDVVFSIKIDKLLYNFHLKDPLWQDFFSKRKRLQQRLTFNHREKVHFLR